MSKKHDKASKKQKVPVTSPEESTSQESLKSPSQRSVTLLAPASSAMNQKIAQNPTALSQYQLVPHRPPVLPGPSVLAEASQNELYRASSKHRRSVSQAESVNKVESLESVIVTEKPKKKEKAPKTKKALLTNSPASPPSQQPSTTKKLEIKSKDPTVNVCLVDSNISKVFRGKEGKQRANEESSQVFETTFFQQERLVLPALTQASFGIKGSSADFVAQMPVENEESERKFKKTLTRGVQCAIFGNSEKIFVISPVINSLLRALAFLLFELNREESDICGKGETKTLMTQIQLLVGDLLNHKINKDFIFDATYSDSKRFEKIFEELKKYLKDVYGSNQEYKDKTEEMKKIFVEFKRKEMEFAMLNEKRKRKEEDLIPELPIKEKDLKQPELLLQNKRLEREQLLADVEFSKRDLKSFQKTLAELDWEIKNSQEQMAAFKKSLASKSKTEIVGKKSPSHKLPSERRRSKSRDSEENAKKKT